MALEDPSRLGKDKSSRNPTLSGLRQHDIVEFETPEASGLGKRLSSVYYGLRFAYGFALRPLAMEFGKFCRGAISRMFPPAGPNSYSSH